MDFVYPPDDQGNKYQAEDGMRFKTRAELREYEGRDKNAISNEGENMEVYKEHFKKLGLTDDQFAFFESIKGSNYGGTWYASGVASSFVLSNAVIKQSEASDKNSRRLLWLNFFLALFAAFTAFNGFMMWYKL